MGDRDAMRESRRSARILEIGDVVRLRVGQRAGGKGFAEDMPNFGLDFVTSPEGLQLNRAFVKIADPKVRRKIIELVKALAAEDDGIA